MADPSRLWIELAHDESGPHGLARNITRREQRFSGWLELIALIESFGAGPVDVAPGSLGGLGSRRAAGGGEES
jgi:hypothetical protein